MTLLKKLTFVSLVILLVVLKNDQILMLLRGSGNYTAVKVLLDQGSKEIQGNTLNNRSSSKDLERNLEPMVLSLDYWEQTGNALDSLFDLQCWANSVGIDKVLQPTVKQVIESTFHFVANRKGSHFEFSDLFDIDHWNLMSVKRNNSPLTSMEYFVQHAIKEVLVVKIRYKDGGNCALDKTSKYKFLPEEGFRVVRIACIDFNKVPSHGMEQSVFQDLIFGNLNPRNFTVLFDQWRGLWLIGEVTRRVDLTASSYPQCLDRLSSVHYVRASEGKLETTTYSPPNCTFPIVYSKRLHVLLDKFMDHFHLTGTRYIAVMLRTQVIRNLQANDQNPIIRAILSDHQSLIEEHNISRTLFFSDVGKHGSLQWSPDSAKSFSGYVYDQLDVNFTPDEMDAALEGITGSKDSVQIALLQRLIVARATCVVLAGGGTFQAQTLIRYLIAHKGQECYKFRLDPDFNLHYAKSVKGF